MASCAGLSADHCCHIAGRVCSFLEERTVPGRRWACGLRRELGSWENVHEDSRYVAAVKPTMDRLGVQCGDWPGPGTTCATCGVVGWLRGDNR